MIQAVVGQRAAHAVDAREQGLLCLFQRHAVLLRIVTGQQAFPDHVVEVQIQECAVHVEQHVID